MLNQSVLVGRITTINKDSEDNKINVTISVPRNYKNENGEYETDMINCTLWKSIASNVNEYCHVGDLIGIKGRIQTTKDNVMELVAEKVTMLATH